MTEDAPSDEALVEAVKNAAEGNFRAFDTLVDRYQSKILANCRYLTRSVDDAEDLAQEVFVKAFFGLKRFEGRSQFKTWIQRIKVNHCLNHVRKKQGKVHVDVQDEVVATAPELAVAPVAEKRADASFNRERVAAVLDAMPDSLRIPLLLRDLDELSYQEISDELGIGLSATKMRIKRARDAFRESYATTEEEALS